MQKLLKKIKIFIFALLLILVCDQTISASDKSIQENKISFMDSTIQANIYEDVSIHLNVPKRFDIYKIVIRSSNKKVFGFSHKTVTNIEKINTPEDRNIMKYSLTPQLKGVTTFKATFYSVGQKMISNANVSLKIVEPTIMKKASIVGKVRIPERIKFKNYNIRKFSEFEDKNYALKNINYYFKSELHIIASKFSLNSPVVTEKNYIDFLNIVSNLRKEGDNIISREIINNLYAVLTTFENNLNNNLIDESIKIIMINSKKTRNATESIEYENNILVNIVPLLPVNKALENLIETSPSRFRGFGDPAANAYASKYANKPNTSKYVYLNNADCTNFVSQVVRAGGRVMNKTWKYDKSLGAKNNYSTYAWKNAQAFKSYYKPAYSSKNFKKFSYNVFPGTVVIADWDGDGKADHAGWVTNADTFWKEYKDQNGKRRTYMNFKVAQHTKNYHLWVSNNTNNWEQMNNKDIYHVIYFQ